MSGIRSVWAYKKRWEISTSELVLYVFRDKKNRNFSDSASLGQSNSNNTCNSNNFFHLPYARHYNPLSIWNRSRLWTADF